MTRRDVQLDVRRRVFQVYVDGLHLADVGDDPLEVQEAQDEGVELGGRGHQRRQLDPVHHQGQGHFLDDVDVPRLEPAPFVFVGVRHGPSDSVTGRSVSPLRDSFSVSSPG